MVRRQAATPTTRLGVESLEERLLMSCDIDKVGSVLIIEGTNSADVATVWIDGNKLKAKIVCGNGDSDTKTVKNAASVWEIQFTGLGGNDKFDNQASGKAALASGGDGDDTLIGSSADDTLQGDAGNDLLEGRGGNDELKGGSENDTLKGESGADLLQGESGNDAMYGGDQNDTMLGGSGEDTVSGGFGDDSIDGGSHDDFLEGGSDDDTIVGGDGNDLMFGDYFLFPPANAVQGNDEMWGKDGNDTMYGSGGDDTMNGGDHDDNLYGGSGKDLLFGDELCIIGPCDSQDPGNDYLEGGNDGQVDKLIGLGGADTFVRYVKWGPTFEFEDIVDFEDGVDKVDWKTS
jgi:Ca2+-binding RTX toxin-like protein